MTKVDQHILGSVEVTDFLKHHWQKKPLLVRQAVPDFHSPLEADELAGLACEEGVESRLIERNDGRWRLENGPFDAQRLRKLGTRDWTLLVQDVDKHLPELAEWLDLFDFIPRWRIDDLMISCAATGGGVGPHTDAYDVFLLQAAGRRQWSIAERFDPATVPDVPLRVLENFKAEQSWTLEPGDMLYLPPNVAHDGIALDDNCMTWSIGFRAPSLRDLFSDLSEWLYQRLPEDRIYSDPDLSGDEAVDGRISPVAFARLRRLLDDALTPDNTELQRWFGAFITEPKHWLAPEPSEETPSATELIGRLTAGESLLRDSRARLAWIRDDEGPMLFVNGEAWPLPAACDKLLQALCTQRHFTVDVLQLAPQDDAAELLRRLHTAGALHFSAQMEDAR